MSTTHLVDHFRTCRNDIAQNTGDRKTARNQIPVNLAGIVTDLGVPIPLEFTTKPLLILIGRGTHLRPKILERCPLYFPYV